MQCRYCQSSCVRAGRYAHGSQRYRCKQCRRYQQTHYRNRACAAGVDAFIVKLSVNGSGIRHIARILGISTQTVLSRLRRLSSNLRAPAVRGQDYEIDELCTYVGRKTQRCWICYALERSSREVVAIAVGSRNKQNLGSVVNRVLVLGAERIYTDRLHLYEQLIPSEKHKQVHGGINHIERKNLSLRHAIRRLGRKTLCYSKSEAMLNNCVKLYLWGRV